MFDYFEKDCRKWIVKICWWHFSGLCSPHFLKTTQAALSSRVPPFVFPDKGTSFPHVSFPDYWTSHQGRSARDDLWHERRKDARTCGRRQETHWRASVAACCHDTPSHEPGWSRWSRRTSTYMSIWAKCWLTKQHLNTSHTHTHTLSLESYIKTWLARWEMKELVIFVFLHKSLFLFCSHARPESLWEASSNFQRVKVRGSILNFSSTAASFWIIRIRPLLFVGELNPVTFTLLLQEVTAQSCRNAEPS